MTWTCSNCTSLQYTEFWNDWACSCENRTENKLNSNGELLYTFSSKTCIRKDTRNILAIGLNQFDLSRRLFCYPHAIWSTKNSVNSVTEANGIEISCKGFQIIRKLLNSRKANYSTKIPGRKSSVTEIPGKAFLNCVFLTKLHSFPEIPESVFHLFYLPRTQTLALHNRFTHWM